MNVIIYITYMRPQSQPSTKHAGTYTVYFTTVAGSVMDVNEE